MEPSPKLRSLAGALFVLLAAVPACSSDDGASGGPSPRERVLAAADATRRAGTARVAQSLLMELPASGGTATSGRLEVETRGFVDMANGGARLDVTTSGAGMAGADALAGDSSLIIIAGEMYISSPFYQQLAPDHEPWLRVALEELAARGISQAGQQDPLAFLDALSGIGEDVEEADPELVQGDEVTAYRAAIDVERLQRELPEERRAAIDSAFGRLGIARLPLQVALDREGRVVRIESDVELAGPSAGGRMRVTLELFDFGVAFDLKRPPKRDVADFAEVFGEVGG